MTGMQELIISAGFTEAGELSIGALEFDPQIREICEGNTCRNYGASWACPPAVGTLEECRERCGQYDKMLLFTRVSALKSSFDFDGMLRAMREFKDCVDRLRDVLPGEPGRYLLLSNEGCGRCKQCTWPDAPCRFPDRLCHSIEGYGFVVSKLARQAGVKYNNGANTVTYFGAVLWRE